MSNEESTYTELQLRTKPAEPISRGNGMLEAAKALQEKQGCWRVIPYQFTEVSYVTLSELDETWWVGSPSELM